MTDKHFLTRLVALLAAIDRERPFPAAELEALLAEARARRAALPRYSTMSEKLADEARARRRAVRR